jgi:hypothetical protein
VITSPHSPLWTTDRCLLTHLYCKIFKFCQEV